jgi:hypothetical protein
MSLRQRIESLAKTMSRLGNDNEYTAKQVSDMLYRELAIQFRLADEKEPK